MRAGPRSIRWFTLVAAGLALLAAGPGAAEKPAPADGHAAAAGAGTTDLAERVMAFDAAVDTLRRDRSLRDSLWTVSESLKAEVDRTADERVRLPLLHARAYLLVGGAPAAEEAAIRDGLRLASALGDEESEMQFLVQLGSLFQAVGRLPEADAAIERLAELAPAHQGSAAAARADYFVARRWITSGRAAEGIPLVERAIPVFERAERWDFLANCHGLIGVAGLYANDFASGRRHLRSAIEFSRRIQRDDLLAAYLGNLGTLERNAGRYDRTLACYEEMRTVADRLGNPLQRAFALQAMGVVLTHMVRFSESIALGESLIVLARSMGSPDFRARGHVVVAFAQASSGRYREAAWNARQVVAMGDSVDPNQRLDATLNLSAYLCHLDSLDTALELVTLARPAARRQGVVYDIRAADGTSKCLRLLGRRAEAVAALETVRPSLTNGVTGFSTAVLADLAGLYAGLGMRDSAEACIRRARAAFLRNREELEDERWRELIADEGSAIAGAELRLHLGSGGADGPAAETCFDRIEPLRARTLIERVAGREHDPGETGAFATAATIRAALQPDEVLLQWTVTPDTSVLFAFSKDGMRAHPLGMAVDSLEWHARELRQLMAQPPDGHGGEREHALSAAAKSIGARLFGPVAADLIGSKRILVSPDGPLHHLPMTYVLAQSVFGGVLEAVPAVASIPSATLFVRARSGAMASGQAGLLAASGPAPDGSGPLPGGREEARWLGRSFEPVTVRLAGTASPGSGGFDGFEGLHFAAHAESNDRTPWQSGILLADPDPDGADGYLRASDIAGMHLSARLAVLSACETAWGALLSGEGLTGLSTAFLSAGVPTVVATQWKVEDRQTVQIMKRFYRELARGAPAATALRAAQLAVASSGHGDPYYWAGFVLIGEPGTTLEIRPKGMPAASLAMMLAGILVAVALSVLVARRRLASRASRP